MCLPGFDNGDKDFIQLSYSVYLHQENTIDGGVTGTVVVQVNQGGDVLVITGLQSSAIFGIDHRLPDGC